MTNRFEEMDVLDIIMEIEGGDMMPENVEEAKTVLEAVSNLRYSQGYYSRLCNALEEYIEETDDVYTYLEDEEY